MRTTSWIAYVACAAVGVAGVVGFKLLRGKAARVDPVPDKPGEVVRELRAIKVPTPSPSPPPPPSLAEAPLPASPVAPPAAPRPVLAVLPRNLPAGYIDDTRQYAASFQPGVSLTGPIPDFAYKYYFPTEEDAAPALAEYDAFAAEAVDSWSTNMEYQLQNFFQNQPESARARISIFCRTSQCMMHMTEIGAAPGQAVDFASSPANVMLKELRRQTWFKQQFVSATDRASTPWVGEAHYQGMVLVRRKP